MKHILFVFTAALLLSAGCTSEKKLAYLNNLTKTAEPQYFTMDAPDYKIQSRDILYITLKAMGSDGMIVNYLGGTSSNGTTNQIQTEGGGYINGYNVDKEGNIIIPVLGFVNVENKTLDEIRLILQKGFEKSYKNAVIEVKLLSFKFTVIGEVNGPGTYVNFNNYLTVLEAIGRAGGLNDFGKRDHILVVRPAEKGSKTYSLDLQDKSILSSEAYFLLPNDVVIVEPQRHKIFKMNLPTITFVITSFSAALTTTLLLINYLGK
jgi:polysaccharide export outer membrane protein